SGSKEHGSKLFKEVFLSQPPKFGWDDLDPGEQKGRALLFTDAYLAHRNPRAHRELKQHRDNQLSESLLLNHLYLLERQARELPDDLTGDRSKGQ
ncbi:MAG: TIGR02391 family protein, partial [Syntrophobacteraceae bacterium]